MELFELNPFLRFASSLLYETIYNDSAVRVTDCRLFFVLEGEAMLTLEQTQYRLVPGSLFYCCGGSRYHIHTGDPLRLIILNFDLTQAHRDQVLPLPPVRDRTKWDAMPIYFDPVVNSFLNGHLFLCDASDYLPRLEQILADFGAADRVGRALSGAQLKTLLTVLHRSRDDAIPPKVAQVQDYIRQNYARSITNRELAEHVGYHEYYLNRIFTAATGQSLHTFLLGVRLNRASFLVLNTDMELKAIPEQVGFGSYPHFSAAFKQAYGLSPAQYRKRLRASI